MGDKTRIEWAEALIPMPFLMTTDTQSSHIKPVTH